MQHSQLSSARPLFLAAVRWLTFPAALAVFAAAAAAIRRGWLPRPELAQMAAFAVTALLASGAERWLPFRADWAAVPAAERRTDRASLLALFLVVDPLLKLAAVPALLSLALPVLHALGGLQLFPTEMPFPAQLLLAVLLAELGSYGMHRLAHRTPALWGIHSFHHSPARLYWLNGFRVNPLNITWHQLASLLVLRLLGAPVVIVHIVATLAVVIAVMQHCNADLRYDGWNQFFGTADLHRWHHATSESEHGSNFGSVTIVWDRVLGTYRRGHAGPAQVGIAGASPDNQGYLGELWQAYSTHSRASFEQGWLGAAEIEDSYCSTCPLPSGRRIPLRLRIRGWLPAPLSGCCSRS